MFGLHLLGVITFRIFFELHNIFQRTILLILKFLGTMHWDLGDKEVNRVKNINVIKSVGH